MAARPADPPRPVIIRRSAEGRGHGGHHGGSWKVAYADFVTAMMAFFLLMWLVGSADKDTLRGLAEFFSDAKVNVGPPGGAGGVLEGFNLTLADPIAVPGSPFEPVAALSPPALAEEPAAVDAAVPGAAPGPDPYGLAAAEAGIRQALDLAPDLARAAGNLLVDVTPEGLRIQLIDREQLSMFPAGSAAMYPHTRRLLEVVTGAIARVPGSLSIRGHTDALAFAPGAAQDNWTLSSDRANATRRAMVDAGLDPARVAEVVGKADTEPLLPRDAHDPRNRRVSIVLRRDRAGAAGPAPSGPAGIVPDGAPGREARAAAAPASGRDGPQPDPGGAVDAGEHP